MKAGTIILCENKHEVCEVLRNITRGDMDYSTAIGNWRSDQIPAKKGDQLPLKCWCGGIYFSAILRKFEYTRSNDLTRKELADLMKEFISLQPNNDKDDWYVSSQGAADSIITNFAEFLGIKLEEQSSELQPKENLP